MSLFDPDLATRGPVILKEDHKWNHKWKVCDKIDPAVYEYGDMIYETSSGKTYFCLSDKYITEIGNNVITKNYKYEPF